MNLADLDWADTTVLDAIKGALFRARQHDVISPDWVLNIPEVIAAREKIRSSKATTPLGIRKVIEREHKLIIEPFEDEIIKGAIHRLSAFGRAEKALAEAGIDFDIEESA